VILLLRRNVDAAIKAIARLAPDAFPNPWIVCFTDEHLDLGGELRAANEAFLWQQSDNGAGVRVGYGFGSSSVLRMDLSTSVG
jgi:hypothetical protein